MMRWQRKLCRFGHQRDRSTRRRPAHGEPPLLLRAAARKTIRAPIARLGNSALHPQYKLVKGFALCMVKNGHEPDLFKSRKTNLLPLPVSAEREARAQYSRFPPPVL